jgi:hypothetical protein
MRFSEIINEASNPKNYGVPAAIDPDVEKTIPGTFIVPELRNTDPYMQYRMGLALAVAQASKSREVKFDQETIWAENFITTAYAEEEQETIKTAANLMGVNVIQVTSTKSQEIDGINKNSPVAKPKPNKYGV